MRWLVLWPVLCGWTAMFTEMRVPEHSAVSGNPINAALAVAEIDGSLSVFLCGGEFHANILLKWDVTTGTFVDRTVEFPELRIKGTSSAHMVDLDADGAVDILLFQTAGAMLFHREGSRFVDRTTHSQLHMVWARLQQTILNKCVTTSVGITDLGNDDYPDLIFNYWSCGLEPWGPVLMMQSVPGKRLVYTDVTDGSKLGENYLISQGYRDQVPPYWLQQTYPGYTYAFSTMSLDVDEDGDLDLITPSDFGTTSINRRDGWNGQHPKFTEVKNHNEMVRAFRFDMGSCILDYDGDGIFDLYLTSIDLASSGNDQLGNRLYRGLGSAGSTQKGYFEQVDNSGAESGQFGWGCCAADFDNDGDEDLYSANGFPKPNYAKDVNRLWLNQEGKFVPVEEGTGLDSLRMGRGVVCTDVDGDGRVDVMVANVNSSWAVYRNEISNGNGYVKVKLVGQMAALLGTRVVLTYSEPGGAVKTLRRVYSPSTLMAQQPSEVHFGVPEGATLVSVMGYFLDVTTGQAPDEAIALNKIHHIRHPTRSGVVHHPNPSGWDCDTTFPEDGDGDDVRKCEGDFDDENINDGVLDIQECRTNPCVGSCHEMRYKFACVCKQTEYGDGFDPNKIPNAKGCRALKTRKQYELVLTFAAPVDQVEVETVVAEACFFSDGMVAHCKQDPPNVLTFIIRSVDTQDEYKIRGLLDFTNLPAHKVRLRSADALAAHHHNKFRTQMRQQTITVSITPGLDIPDDSRAGATAVLTAPPGSILDVDIHVSITHTFLADLTITLISPAGTRVVLLARRSCGGNDDLDGTFDDEGSALVCAQPTIGSIIPSTPLSAVDGEDAGGMWQLFVEDDFSGDVGVVTQVDLILTVPEPFVVKCIHPGQHQVQVPNSEQVLLYFVADVVGIVVDKPFKVNGMEYNLTEYASFEGPILTLLPPGGSWGDGNVTIDFPSQTVIGPSDTTMVASSLTFYTDRTGTSSTTYKSTLDADCTKKNTDEFILSVCQSMPFNRKFSYLQQAKAEIECGSFVVTLAIIGLDAGEAAATTAALEAALTSADLTTILSTNGVGNLVSGSVVSITSNALVARDFIVDNGVGTLNTGSVVTITFTTNSHGAVAIPVNSTLRVIYPFDWIVSNTVPSPLQLSMTVDGAAVDINHVDATGFDSVGKTFEFSMETLTDNVGPDTVVVLTLDGSAGQTTLPASCMNLNSWVWGVLALYQGETYSFILQNPPTDKCLTYRAIVFGDPHFNSFSGGTYDILGTPGRIYNIISDVSFQWNARFVFPGNKLGQSYIGSCGFRVHNVSIVVPVDGLPSVDGVPVVQDQKVRLIPGERWFLRVVGAHILLRVPGFRIALTETLKAHHKKLPHFDMTADMVPEEATWMTHGLLGQTARFKAPVRPVPRGNKAGKGVIEGEVHQYVVSSLLGTDFQYNQFQAVVPSRMH